MPCMCFGLLVYKPVYHNNWVNITTSDSQHLRKLDVGTAEGPFSESDSKKIP